MIRSNYSCFHFSFLCECFKIFSWFWSYFPSFPLRISTMPFFLLDWITSGVDIFVCTAECWPPCSCNYGANRRDWLTNTKSMCFYNASDDGGSEFRFYALFEIWSHFQFAQDQVLNQRPGVVGYPFKGNQFFYLLSLLCQQKVKTFELTFQRSNLKKRKKLVRYFNLGLDFEFKCIF